MKKAWIAVASLLPMMWVAGCGGDDSSQSGDAGGDATADSGGGSDASQDATTDVGAPDGGGNDAGDSGVSDAASDASDGGASDGGVSDGGGDGGVSDGGGDGGCDTVTSPWHYVVDPVNGTDVSTSTGSGTSGGSSSNACAFKTITHAISVIVAANNPPVAGTQILVTGVSTVSAGETFPIEVPKNVLIKGTGGTVTVNVPSAKSGFDFASTGSGLDSLTIDGQSQVATHGITAGTGSDTTDVISNVVVQSFLSDDILVSGSGALKISDGTQALSSKAAGLHVTDTAQADVTPSSTQVLFKGNLTYGVEVDGSANVKMAGDLGNTPPSTATILVDSNTLAGVFVQQTPNQNNPPPLNDIAKIAIINTGSNGVGDGLAVYGGSVLKLRGSYVLKNAADGIHVPSNPNNVSGAGDVSKIDLGASSQDYGLNRVQDGTDFNGAAGICLDLSASLNQNLAALGNNFGTNMDCSTTAATLTKGKCLAGAKEPVGISGSQNNTVSVSKCTLL